MAFIPDIQLSDRRLGVLGPIRRLSVEDRSSAYEAAGKGVGALADGVGKGLGAYFRIKAKQESDAADHAAALWEDGWRKRHNGYVVYDRDGNPSQVKGLKDYAWTDYPEDENALTALRDYEKSFRESAEYRKLGREGRERFELRIVGARQRAMEQANALFDRDGRAKMELRRKQTEENLLNRARDVRVDASPVEFDLVAKESGARIAASRCAPSIVDDSALLDEHFDATRLSFADERPGEIGGAGSFRDLHAQEARKVTDALRAERLASILENGLSGRIPPDSAFAMAGELVDYLEDRNPETGEIGKPRVSAEVANGMRVTIEKYAERYAAGIQGRAHEAKAVGDLSRMDEISRSLREASEALPEGSRARAMLAGEHAQMESACDRRAKYDVMSELDRAVREGRYDPSQEDDRWRDPSFWGFPEKSRAGKVFAETRAAFDESWRKRQARGFAARRDRNVLDLRGQMLQCAAAGQPQEFLDRLTSAVVRHEIAGSDFTRLANEFNNGWMKGFRDDPGQLPKRVDVANRLLDVVKRTFGEDALAFTSAIETDDNGDVALDRTGRFAFTPGVDPKGVSYGREVPREDGFLESFSTGYGILKAVSPYANRRESFSADEFKRLMDVALQLSLLDGCVVRQDPITLRPVDDPKGHRVDAVGDFAAWCESLRDGKAVLSAAQEIQRRGNYENRVREQGRNADLVRRERMRTSRPMEAEKTDDGQD